MNDSVIHITKCCKKNTVKKTLKCCEMNTIKRNLKIKVKYLNIVETVTVRLMILITYFNDEETSLVKSQFLIYCDHIFHQIASSKFSLSIS